MRTALLESLADIVATLRSDSTVRVAIDGVDGAGKTFFADELATLVQSRGRPVIRASADHFHNPRELRYRRGRSSPEGYYHDTYNYPELYKKLLAPLGSGGSGIFQRAAFDLGADKVVFAAEELALPNSILIFDGMFLHRPELRAVWDFSLFLTVPFSVSVPRGASRGPGWGSPDPAAESNRRYVDGQKLYLNECRPESLATVVVDNSDLAVPLIVAGREVIRRHSGRA
jgi:uridine kinase